MKGTRKGKRRKGKEKKGYGKVMGVRNKKQQRKRRKGLREACR